jgi:hypothetical protein
VIPTAKRLPNKEIRFLILIEGLFNQPFLVLIHCFHPHPPKGDRSKAG